MDRAERRFRTETINERYRQKWRRHGYPGAYRGAWRGIKEERKILEGAERARVRDELKCIDTYDGEYDGPAPYKTKHQAQWRVY